LLNIAGRATLEDARRLYDLIADRVSIHRHNDARPGTEMGLIWCSGRAQESEEDTAMIFLWVRDEDPEKEAEILIHECGHWLLWQGGARERPVWLGAEGWDRCPIRERQEAEVREFVGAFTEPTTTA
jgi:hypothetical protein